MLICDVCQPTGGFGGYGHGHNYGQYRRVGGYTDTRYKRLSLVNLLNLSPVWKVLELVFRPLSCYSASAASVISGDLAIEETLVTCDNEADVCFGKVKLNSS